MAQSKQWVAVDPQPKDRRGLPIRKAPEGTIYVCGACGKTAQDCYGDPGTSWDESCSLNAVLCYSASDPSKGTV